MLIVIDMQNDFIDGTLGTPEAQAIVPNVIEKIKNHDGMIVFTRDTHGKNYADTLEGKKLPILHCIKNTDGWQIQEDVFQTAVLKTPNDYTIIDKGTFGSIGLMFNNWIFNNDDEPIEICGLCTDICVVSNALMLRAVYPNRQIIVDSKCCAGVTPEAHEAALKVMQSCQIDVI